MSHFCHVTFCDVSCSPEKLMCSNHWKKVPPEMKEKVYEHYKKGQCDSKRPSNEWLKAARAAINYVNRLENFNGILR